MITDKLASYGAAKRAVMPGVEHRQAQGTEQQSGKLAPADAPTRAANEAVQIGRPGRFLSAHDQINNLFNLRRDHATAAEHRASRTQTFRVWAEICGVVAMI
jgi:putative transposase